MEPAYPYYPNATNYGLYQTNVEIRSMILAGRRLPDVLIRSIALHIACFYAFGHLLGLQGHTARNQRNMVIACMLFPLLPAVLLLRDAFDSVASLVEYVRRRPRTGLTWEFYLSGSLGMQAAPKGSGSGLSRHLLACTPPAIRLTRKREEYDWRWAARMFLWFIFTAQATMSVVLLISRIRLRTYTHESSRFWMPKDHAITWLEQQIGRFADSPLDQHNGAVAVGGLATGSSILGNYLLNLQWEQSLRTPAAAGAVAQTTSNAPCELLVIVVQCLVLA